MAGGGYHCLAFRVVALGGFLRIRLARAVVAQGAPALDRTYRHPAVGEALGEHLASPDRDFVDAQAELDRHEGVSGFVDRDLILDLVGQIVEMRSRVLERYCQPP